jgi:hypothetical protein
MTIDSRALCAVCNAPAIGKKQTKVHFIFKKIFFYIGRNFDAYTCLSCKGNKYNLFLSRINHLILAFFRRNAYNAHVS